MFAKMVRGWNEMSTFRKLLRVISIALIVFALWALTPYLYNRQVNEAFPAAASAPTAMADQAAMADKPTAMADKPAGPIAQAQGSFVAGSTPGDRAAGKATVYKLENSSQILRLEDFSTTNGPDLFVVLSSNANPDADGIGKDNYLQLAALKGNQGNQNYELPGDIDLGKYKSVVIWCRTFNVVFGYAALQPAA